MSTDMTFCDGVEKHPQCEQCRRFAGNYVMASYVWMLKDQEIKDKNCGMFWEKGERKNDA